MVHYPREIMSSIEIGGLRKVFEDDGGEIVAIEDLDLTVNDSEFLALVGPSGCGKSTTLRMIAGLEDPTEGQILFDGEDVTKKSPQGREVVMVFQDYALYPHMSARENMSFGLTHGSDLPKDQIEQRVTEAAEMLGISDLLNQRPGEISGGQQQRVALGRAIVREPNVFLMDEPLSNLDAKLRSQMRTELQELHAELGITTIYVTHDQEEAMTMADKLAVLNMGELQQVGSPLECYQKPANTFVAGFIGSPQMNMFKSRINGNSVNIGEYTYQLPDDIRNEIPDSVNEITLGVRPEDIRVVDSPTENTFSTSVNVIERMGDLTYLYTDLVEGECIVTLSGDDPVSENDEIEILFPPSQIHIFDGTTGEAIKNQETRQEVDDSVSVTPQ
jgi:multiple sugar transport system ATP-binding protein